MPAAATVWQVVGGADTGGIVVRAGRALDSDVEPRKLALGAKVRQEERAGNRLRYTRLEGAGPDAGWVSLTLRDKPLLAEWRQPPEPKPRQPDPPAPEQLPPAFAGRGPPAPPPEAGPASEEGGGWAEVEELLGKLKKRVEDILATRQQMERDVERNARDVESAQRLQSTGELELSRVLEELRSAADAYDPPPRPPSRLSLRCASPGCHFRVHQRQALGGFCCVPCHNRRGHGPRCERARAPHGAREASEKQRPVPAEELAQIELQEAIQLAHAHFGARPPPGAENSMLLHEPRWSRSGRDAVGKWVSSIDNETFGDLDSVGPAQLLQGGQWVSRRGRVTNEWIVFDLGSEQLVSEVRTRGYFLNTRNNARKMMWQKGEGLQGAWETVATLEPKQNPLREWCVAAVDPPVRCRWSRLYIKQNWGSPDYVWLHGFCLRIISEKSFEEEWREQKERRAKKESGEGEDAQKGSEKDGSTGDSDAHKRLTLKDLRCDDVDFQQLYGYQKLVTHALLWDRVAAFEDKPYIDYRRQAAPDYAKLFLAQPQEMGWSLDFHPSLFCELAYEGFNPTSLEMASDNDLMIQVLTPCFEPARNVLRCLHAHVGKKARKRAKHYTMTVDTAYDEVMLEVIRQHGEGWLWRGERWVLRKLREEGYTGSRKINFAARSFELWDRDGRLVAGDLGYTLGGVYVSQTGFRKEGTSGAGEVQLLLTAALLHKMGHEWFDLGQARTYKDGLGAVRLNRQDWLERFLTVRDGECVFSHEPIAGDELMGHLLQAMEGQRGVARLPDDEPPQRASLEGPLATASSPEQEEASGAREKAEQEPPEALEEEARQPGFEARLPDGEPPQRASLEGPLATASPPEQEEACGAREKAEQEPRGALEEKARQLGFEAALEDDEAPRRAAGEPVATRPPREEAAGGDGEKAEQQQPEASEEPARRPGFEAALEDDEAPRLAAGEPVATRPLREEEAGGDREKAGQLQPEASQEPARQPGFEAALEDNEAPRQAAGEPVATRLLREEEAGSDIEKAGQQQLEASEEPVRQPGFKATLEDEEAPRQAAGGPVAMSLVREEEASDDREKAEQEPLAALEEPAVTSSVEDEAAGDARESVKQEETAGGGEELLQASEEPPTEPFVATSLEEEPRQASEQPAAMSSSDTEAAGDAGEVAEPEETAGDGGSADQVLRQASEELAGPVAASSSEEETAGDGGEQGPREASEEPTQPTVATASEEQAAGDGARPEEEPGQAVEEPTEPVLASASEEEAASDARERAEEGLLEAAKEPRSPAVAITLEEAAGDCGRSEEEPLQASKAQLASTLALLRHKRLHLVDLARSLAELAASGGAPCDRRERLRGLALQARSAAACRAVSEFPGLCTPPELPRAGLGEAAAAEEAGEEVGPPEAEAACAEEASAVEEPGQEAGPPEAEAARAEEASAAEEPGQELGPPEAEAARAEEASEAEEPGRDPGPPEAEAARAEEASGLEEETREEAVPPEAGTVAAEEASGLEEAREEAVPPEAGTAAAAAAEEAAAPEERAEEEEEEEEEEEAREEALQQEATAPELEEEEATEEAAADRKRNKEKRRREALELAKQLRPALPDQEARGRRVWIVVGGGQAGGLLVRAGESLRSLEYRTRLAAGAAVEEISFSGNRLHFRRLRGDGPQAGWVSVVHQGRRLVEALTPERWAREAPQLPPSPQSFDEF